MTGAVSPERRRLGDLDRALEGLGVDDRETFVAFGEFLDAVGVPADGRPSRDPIRARQALEHLERMGDRIERRRR